jgi:hypothetical protein
VARDLRLLIRGATGLWGSKPKPVDQIGLRVKFGRELIETPDVDLEQKRAGEMSSLESMKQSTNLQIGANRKWGRKWCRKWGMKSDEAGPEPNAMPFQL